MCCDVILCRSSWCQCTDNEKKLADQEKERKRREYEIVKKYEEREAMIGRVRTEGMVKDISKLKREIGEKDIRLKKAQNEIKKLHQELHDAREGRNKLIRSRSGASQYVAESNENDRVIN